MKKQNHYTEEKQILDKIDKKRKQANDLNLQAELLESLVHEHFNKGEVWEGRERREQAMKLRKQAKRIEDTVLPALGDVLYEFKTIPMFPITGEDHSVSSRV